MTFILTFILELLLLLEIKITKKLLQVWCPSLMVESVAEITKLFRGTNMNITEEYYDFYIFNASLGLVSK